MKINLQERLEKLEQSKAQFIANAHACEGQIELVKELLAEQIAEGAVPENTVNAERGDG